QVSQAPVSIRSYTTHRKELEMPTAVAKKPTPEEISQKLAQAQEDMNEEVDNLQPAADPTQETSSPDAVGVGDMLNKPTSSTELPAVISEHRGDWVTLYVTYTG